MSAVALGEKILSLLEESARSSTYKSALLLALIDRAPEHLDDGAVPVSSLAERVIELYWPQTVAYPTTGVLLMQNQGTQARIVSDIAWFRAETGVTSRALPPAARATDSWPGLVRSVELTLAEYPIPRLQRPFSPFLYSFDWPWAEEGRWAKRAYDTSSRAVTLHDDVADGLVALSPLLRPFITRWWADKAAQLNPDVEAARSVVEFEDFLFGRDRVALDRVAESLLDLQQGDCFYCGGGVGRGREIDHFIPWSHSGDDGLDNLVAACHRCNNAKRAMLPGPEHLGALLTRNDRWNSDLVAIAREKRWPRDRPRSLSIVRSMYLRAPEERPLWTWSMDARGPIVEPMAVARPRFAPLLGAP